MEFERIKGSIILRFFIVLLFFISPLIFFTDLTRNPYFFQITLINITISLIFILFIILSIKKKEVLVPDTPVVKIFILLLVIFFLTSIYSYFNHNDFFKPSMKSEFRRVWLFTLINSFLPFIMVHYVGKNKEIKIKSEYSFGFIILWGSLWLIYPYLKSEGNFFDLYGVILWLIGGGYLVIKTKEINSISLLNIIMLGAFYASVYGILQYFGFEMIWPKVLNPYGRRAVSSFGNPNFISSYVLMLFPIAIFYLVKAANNLSKLTYTLYALSYLSMIFASLTRSSLIGLFFMLIFLLSFKEYRNFIGVNLKNYKKIFLIFALVFLLWPDQNLKPLSFGVINRIYEGVKGSINKFTLNIEKKDVYPSFHQRLVIWSSAYYMFLENPISGKGWGGFELFYPFYQGFIMREFPVTRQLRTHANNAHNEILEIASQTGIAGLGISIYLIFFIFYSFYRKYHISSGYQDDQKIYLLTLLSAIFAMLVDNMLNVSIHFAVPGMLFFSLIGIYSSESFNRMKKIVLTKLLTFFLLVCGVLAVFNIKFWVNQFLREIYYFKGFKEVRQQNFEKAKIDLETAYNFNSREVNNNYELANLYARIGEIDKAIYMYNESLKANAGYDEIYFNIGVIEKRKGFYEDALKHLRTSLWINPLNEKAYYAVSEIYLIKNDFNKLIPLIEDGVRIHIYNSYLYNILGYSYEKSNDYNKAIYFYRKAVENDPLNQTYIMNFKRLNKTSTPDLDLFISLYHDVALQRNKISDEMYGKIKAIEDKFKDNIRFKYILARYYFETKELKKSLQLLEEIVEEDPYFTSALYSLAIVYEKLSLIDKAINAYENYYNLNPDERIKDRINKLKNM